MKICVLSGSPKGTDSITLQYIRFLELAFPAHSFTVEHVGQHIAAIEAKDDEFRKVVQSIDAADAVLFATPVYYMLVPAQFKRFIELLFSRDARSAFLGKYSASVTTSIHFFDHTANEYLHAVAEDLGMHWAGTFMAKMDDLVHEDNQRALLLFFEDFLVMAAKKPAVQRTYPPLRAGITDYRPAGIPMPIDTGGKQVVILTDAAAGSSLDRMVTRLASCFGTAASVVPIDEAKVKGGCLGCCSCAFDNTCVYTDGFARFWRETVLAADIIVIAATIRDRYLSAEFKQLLDRSFFLGHIPAMQGKQVAYLISGPLSQCSTLREVMGAYVTIQGANLAGIVTDEEEVSYATDTRIDALANRAARLAQSGYLAPGGFPLAGGRKVFRDEIWGGMRAVFRADHAYYRSHGFYDFPTGDIAARIRTFVLWLVLSFPQARASAKKEMKKQMLAPFGPVLAQSRVLKQWREEHKP